MLLPSRWSRTSIRTILHHSILIINLIDGSNSNKSSNFLILFYFFCYCLSTKYPIREQDAECHFFAIKVSPNLFDSHFTLSGEDISQIVILQALKLFLSWFIYKPRCVTVSLKKGLYNLFSWYSTFSYCMQFSYEEDPFDCLHHPYMPFRDFFISWDSSSLCMQFSFLFDTAPLHISHKFCLSWVRQVIGFRNFFYPLSISWFSPFIVRSFRSPAN